MTWAGRSYTWNDTKGVITGITFNGRTTSIGTNGNLLDTLFTFPSGAGGSNLKIANGILESPLKLTSDAAYVGTIERYMASMM